MKKLLTKVSPFPLKLRDTKSEVLSAQKLLQKNGSTIKLSGVFTIGMMSAVKAFQKKNGLKVTGEIDAKTWEKLSATKPKKTVKMGAKK